jgi:hypothetical protein
VKNKSMFLSKVLALEKTLLRTATQSNLTSKSMGILKDLDLSNLFVEEEIYPHLLEKNPIQFYKHDGFSDLNITLAKNKLFSMNLYFWGKKQLPIHSHPCGGVVKVLKGSTLDINFKFKVSERSFKNVASGELVITSRNLYEANSVYRFNSTLNSPHLPYKLTDGSVTFVIRGNDKKSEEEEKEAKHYATFIYPSLRFTNMKVNDSLVRLMRLADIQLTSGSNPSFGIKSIIKMIPAEDICYFLIYAKSKKVFSDKILELFRIELQRFSKFSDYLKALDVGIVKEQKFLKAMTSLRLSNE